jgi:phosphate-selective porin OprO/OprP
MSKRPFISFSLTISSLLAAHSAAAQGQPTEPLPQPTAPAPTASPPAPSSPETPSSEPIAPPTAPAAPATSPTPNAPVAVPPAAVPPAASSTPPPAESKKKPSGALSIESEDGDNKLEFHALVHADGRWFFPRTGPDTTDTFVIRRARPSLDAKLFKYFELKLQADFAGSKLQILDAYGNLHFIDEAQLRMGKGKPPVGFERLKSPADIMFAERGFPTELVPNRDVGVQLHGQLWKGAVEYAGGVYNGVPDGQTGDQDENEKKDYEGRIFVRPFLPFGEGPLSGIGVGIAGTVGKEEGALATYKTSGQQTFFAPAGIAQADGMRYVTAPQAAYYFGPAAVLFEYVRSKQRVSDGAAGFTQLDATAFQLQGSFLLGGSQSYQGVKVDHPLDPKSNHWGAVELAARYHTLHFDPRVFDTGFADPSSSVRLARAWTLGLTWHFARRLRALVNYEKTTFEGGAPDGGNKDAEGLLVTRLQVAF